MRTLNDLCIKTERNEPDLGSYFGYRATLESIDYVRQKRAQYRGVMHAIVNETIHLKSQDNSVFRHGGGTKSKTALHNINQRIRRLETLRAREQIAICAWNYLAIHFQVEGQILDEQTNTSN